MGVTISTLAISTKKILSDGALSSAIVTERNVFLFPDELDTPHPEPWEIVFSSDFTDKPPTMTWKYPEPRALSAVELVPLPLSMPVLVNTLNMGDEYQVTRRSSAMRDFMSLSNENPRSLKTTNFLRRCQG